MPIFEAAGQATGAVFPLPSWASVQATRPSAAEGLRPIPAGRAVRAVLTLELASGSGGSKGTSTATTAAAGESVRSVPGETVSFGLNGTASQPVGLTPGGSNASNGVEPLGKPESGTSTESARRKVEYVWANSASAGLRQVLGVVRKVPLPATPVNTSRLT